LIGTITASDAVAIAVSVVATVVVITLFCCAVSLLRSARQMHVLVEELTDHAGRILTDAERATVEARAELRRVDDLVGSAEAITNTVGSASRLAQVAVSRPLIKVMAFRAGTARAGRRLRGVG
jgi:hypothetical protein